MKPRHPRVELPADWPSKGSPVEVAMNEDGLVGSRYSGSVVKIDGDRALVAFDEMFEDEAGTKRLKEWTPLKSCRPPPPPTPSDFFR